MIPSEIRINAERRSLAITWDDGSLSLLPASRLRALSRAAQHIRSSIDGREHPFHDVTVTGAKAVGSYAVRLVFSDGHDRGIYPWRYLREIADTQA
ncbi:gamma-butyrobetaine hydroxylase-like domain-containing protein [Mesorhizobium shangrilense]|uniref:Gamma-butyrobetaine hydroxylase-like domain-containing protein n=1 Tax=Mesorhizobium shangrilense TaxID=460060 RepID=A0ABV2DS84_9HYPH